MSDDPIPPHPDFHVCGFGQREGALLAAGDGDRALGRLRLALRRAEALASEPESEAYGDAAFEVGSAYDHMGDHANAETWFARSLAVPDFRAGRLWVHQAPSHALRYLWRGDFARAETFILEAIAHARAGRSLGEDALVSALTTHAEALVGLGRPAEAITAAEEALALFRASAWIQRARGGFEMDLLRLLGQAQAALGHTDEALARLDAAVAKSAGLTTRLRLDALLAAAEAYRDAGRPAEAAAYARQALAWWDDVLALRRQSGLMLAEGAHARAALAAAWGLHDAPSA